MAKEISAADIQIRPGKDSDRQAVVALMPYLADFAIPTRRQAEHLWSGDAQMAEAVLSQSSASSFIDIAEAPSGQVVGLIMVSLREEMLSHEPSAHLEAIVVAPEYRGLGLGSKLTQHCETRVKALGAKTLTLHVFNRNQRARALYAAHSFDEELIRAIKWLD